MYGAIFWWVVKLRMAAALAAGGFLLMLLIANYGIAEAKAREIRATLEARRGVR